MTSRRAKPVYFLPSELLPHGFQYPQQYKELVSTCPYVIGRVNEDWCFIDEEDIARLCHYARQVAPSLTLVPFMRRNGEDGVACFDGASTDGNPKVYQFNYCVDIGYGGGRLDFSQWLARIPPAEDDED